MGAQAEFWGPRVLTLPDLLIAPHPASTGTTETSQMALKRPQQAQHSRNAPDARLPHAMADIHS